MKILLLLFLFFVAQSNTQVQNFEVLNPQVEQGGVAIIRINNQQLLPACISAFSKVFQPNREHQVFIGIDVTAKIGKEPLYVVECLKSVELSQEVYEIEILPKNFPARNRSAFNATAKWRRERAIIEDAFNNGGYFEKYFEGNFIRPLDRIVVDASRTIGDQSSSFGEGHGGVDLITLNPATRKHNRPVKATNKGRVALIARNFSTEGNMVIIDHGSGIFSIYMHLSSFGKIRDEVVVKGVRRLNARDIQVNDTIEKNQIIGISGQSGNARRSGPHLHFAIKVRGEDKLNDVYVDPLAFIDTMNQYVQ